MITPEKGLADKMAWWVALALVLNMSFSNVAPYFIIIPEASVRLVDQSQNFLWAALMLLFGYLWGQNSGNKAKDQTISTLAATAQNAQAALAPLPENVIPVAAGDSVTVKADP